MQPAARSLDPRAPRGEAPRGDPRLKLERLKRVVVAVTAVSTGAVWWLVGSHPAGSAASTDAAPSEATVQQPQHDDDFFGDGPALSDGGLAQPVNRPILRSGGS